MPVAPPGARKSTATRKHPGRHVAREAEGKRGAGPISTEGSVVLGPTRGRLLGQTSCVWGPPEHTDTGYPCAGSELAGGQTSCVWGPPESTDTGNPPLRAAQLTAKQPRAKSPAGVRTGHERS
jgi:hypothetical protein